MADNEDENDLPLEELANLDLENVPLPEQNPVFQQEFQGNWDGVQPQPVFPPVDNQLIQAIGDWEDVQPQQQDNQLLFDVLVAQLLQEDDRPELPDFPPEANVDNQLLSALGGTMHCHRMLRIVEEVYDEQDITIRLIAHNKPLIDMVVECPGWQDYSKTRERTPFKEEVRAQKAVQRAMHDTRGRSEMVPDDSFRVEIIKDATSAEDVPVSVRQFFKLYVCNEFNPHPNSAHTMMDRRRPHVGYEEHKLEPDIQMWKVIAWTRMGSEVLETEVVASIDRQEDYVTQNWFPVFTDTVFPVLVRVIGYNRVELPHKNIFSWPLTDADIEPNEPQKYYEYRSSVSLVWKFREGRQTMDQVRVGLDDKYVETQMFNADLVSIRWEYHPGHDLPRDQLMITWIIDRIIDYYDNDMDIVGLLSDEIVIPPEDTSRLSQDITRDADIVKLLAKNSPKHCSIHRFGIVMSKGGLLVVSEMRDEHNFNSLLKECTYVLHDGVLCCMTNYCEQWRSNSYHLPEPRLPFPYTPYIVIMEEGVNELDITNVLDGQQVHRFGALYRSDPQMSSEMVIDWYGLVADFGIGLPLPITFGGVVSSNMIPDYVQWRYIPRFNNPQKRKYYFHLSLYRSSEVERIGNNHKRLTDWINVWISGPEEINDYMCSLRCEYTLERRPNNQFVFVYQSHQPRLAPFRLYMVCNVLELFGQHQLPIVSQMQYYFAENLTDDGMLYEDRSPNEEIRNMVMAAFVKSDKYNAGFYTRHRQLLVNGDRLQFYHQ